MKVTIDYLIRVTKDIEITPEEYCKLYANSNSIAGVFPEESFDRNISYDKEAMEELKDYLDKKNN
nr:MAG TPA: hypothetical protein [Caudoviricetes sp.]